MPPSSLNAPVPGIPYFAPQHEVTPGIAIASKGKIVPTLFTPLKIRGATLKNRIVVAPMCQYSTADSGPDVGALTPYHVATLGHYALKGSSLVFIEATGVQPNGRISPNCPGLWSDDQINGVKAVADFIHSQSGLCGIQLAHAGRKSSCVAPFIAMKHKKASMRATKEVGGWPDNVVAPTGGQDFIWDAKLPDDPSGGYWIPRELSTEDIKQTVQDFKLAALRAVKAGVDVIEIHGAHGYLVHQFLSPLTNRRTDEYGGSFENRTRLVIEIIKEIREAVPESMPLFLRLSATEWMDDHELGKQLGTWNVEETSKLAAIVSDLGVDLLDVSSGGNHPQQTINMFSSSDYQTRIAAQLRRELRSAGKPMLVGAVGLITEAQQARDIVQDEPASIQDEAAAAALVTDSRRGKAPMADLVLIARQFLREPEWVLRTAAALDVDVAWPSQFLRVRFKL